MEQKVFRSGQNWKPTPTVPRTPKISAPPVKGQRNMEPAVKSLSKPVNSIRKQLNSNANEENQMLQEIGGFEQTLGMPPGSGQRLSNVSSNTKSAAQHQFYQSIQKRSMGEDSSLMVKLDSEMSYDQARSLLHKHILDLDI